MSKNMFSLCHYGVLCVDGWECIFHSGCKTTTCEISQGVWILSEGSVTTDVYNHFVSVHSPMTIIKCNTDDCIWKTSMVDGIRIRGNSATVRPSAFVIVCGWNGGEKYSTYSAVLSHMQWCLKEKNSVVVFSDFFVCNRDSFTIKDSTFKCFW